MINCSDCSDRRLFTRRVSPVTGLTADHPAAAPIADNPIMTPIKPTKISTGSGRTLPSRSTASRNRLCSCRGCGVRPPGRFLVTREGTESVPEAMTKGDASVQEARLIVDCS